MAREPLKVTDFIKIFIVIVAAMAFLASVAVKLINPDRNDIGNVSTVFLGVSSLVLGASSLSGYLKNNKKGENE